MKMNHTCCGVVFILYIIRYSETYNKVCLSIYSDISLLIHNTMYVHAKKSNVFHKNTKMKWKVKFFAAILKPSRKREGGINASAAMGKREPEDYGLRRCI